MTVVISLLYILRLLVRVSATRAPIDLEVLYSTLKFGIPWYNYLSCQTFIIVYFGFNVSFHCLLRNSFTFVFIFLFFILHILFCFILICKLT